MRQARERRFGDHASLGFGYPHPERGESVGAQESENREYAPVLVGRGG
jgi:hypothetical protein